MFALSSMDSVLSRFLPCRRNVENNHDIPPQGTSSSSSASSDGSPDGSPEEGNVPPSENARGDEYYSAMEGCEDSESTNSDAVPVQVRELFANATMSQLESGVEMGTRFVENLDTVLSKCPDQIKGKASLSQAVKTLGSQNTNAEVIIGVVGQTGAGKSSVINSILDEERIVPTNCMRACTAVVTKIAYNHGEQPYTAEIDFIEVDEWKKELEILFQDLEDGDERSRKNAKSDFAIAHAKMKAVYPSLEDFLQSSPEELAQHESVCKLLGTKISFSENDSSLFYEELQSYVDSKKKGKKRKRNKGSFDKHEAGELEFWPLIRVVRLYVRSPVLSTGAVIVDLPGTQDSNAARAAVAEKYQESCKALWIVTPITRAVNDKTAQKLLDESARAQLKLDCGFNRITFICSKTDDIRFAEVQDSIDMDEEYSVLSQKREEIAEKRGSLQNALARLRDKKISNEKSLKQMSKRMGKTAPELHAATVPVKRKPENDIDSPSPKTPRLGASKNLSNTATNGHIDDKIGPSSNESEHVTTAGTIRERLGDVLNEKEEISSQIQQTESQLEHMDTLQEDAKAEFHAQCVLARNHFTKSTVREDFASTVEELDQELAQDEPDFDPDTAIRDYEALARSLSVFCVSSRAYQILQGRFANERLVPGFRKIEDTEITQLQSHCVKLTETERQRNCNQFLNDFTQLLNSLRLWSSSAARTLTDRELGEFKDNLNLKLDELHSELQLSVLSKFSYACAQAEDVAAKVVSSWNGGSKDKSKPVIRFQVYKAICTRSGVYTNAQGSYDWNRDMARPLLKFISPGWERFFSEKGSAILDSFTKKSRDLLESFHQSIEDYAEAKGMASAFFQTLRQQLETFYGNFADISTEMIDIMDKKQRVINRSFSVAIYEALSQGYEACRREKGKGSFQRMKNIMEKTVEKTGQKMFERSTNKARSRLEMMARSIKDDMAFRLGVVKRKISADYKLLVTKLEDEKPSSLELSIKAEVLEIVKSAEFDFKEALESDERDSEIGEENKLGGKWETWGKTSGDASREVDESSGAMEGVETNLIQHDKPGAVKTEEAVLDSQGLKEKSQEASTESEQNLGAMEEIGTSSMETVKVKLEETEATTLELEHVEATPRDESIEAGKREDAIRGVETCSSEPVKVKVEEVGGTTLGSESLKSTVGEAPAEEERSVGSDSGLKKGESGGE